ncbi:MAG: hypothetical protein ABH879_07935 [archaeon]
MADLTTIIGEGTKARILSLLAAKRSLPARGIYNELRLAYASSISYQAIHKALKELLAQGVLCKKGMRYSISSIWIDKIGGFVRAVNDKCNRKVHIFDGMRVITFSNLSSFDRFLFDYEDNYHKSRPGLPVCWRSRHYYWPLAYSKVMFDAQKVKGNRESYKLFLGNSPLDRWTASFYSRLGVKTRIIDARQESFALAVYGDQVMEINLSEELEAKLGRLYSGKKSISDVDLAGFFAGILEVKGRIKVRLQNSATISGSIRSQILSGM